MIWLVVLLMLLVAASAWWQYAWQQRATARLAEQADAKADAKLQVLRTEWSHTLGQLVERIAGAQTLALQQTQEGMARAVTEIHVQLKNVEEQSRRIQETGRQVLELQDLLKAPKLRGGIGETLLGYLLEQVLPSGRGRFFSEQYRFKDGRQVDAVIHVGERLVCVDAKFPLEHFRLMTQADGEEAQHRARREFLADVKQHVNDIADKYILPEEGTYDFALMYIPAENVYYETILKDEPGEREGLFAHALRRRVIPVSPNNFYAYLQVILLGLKGLSIERGAQQVMQRLAGLRTELDRLQSDLIKTGNHLKGAHGSCESSVKRLTAVQETVRQMELPGTAAAPRVAQPQSLEAAP